MSLNASPLARATDEQLAEVRELFSSRTLSLSQCILWMKEEASVEVGRTTLYKWLSGTYNQEWIDKQRAALQPPKSIERIDDRRKKIKEKRKEIGKALHKGHNERKKEEKRIQNSAKGKGVAKNLGAVVEEKNKKSYTKKTQNILKEEDNILFKPNEGPQEDFLAAPETDVLYGGAAGGGKSYAMVVDPLRYAHKSKHRALILRRTLKELRQLIDISRELYPKAFPGARFKEAEKTWKFPSGARIEFNYLEKEGDVYQYQGQDFTWIGFDELTQLPTEFAWNYLASRLRTTDPDIELYMRATANPGGVGHSWVKKRYIDPAEHNAPFDVDGISRRFIPALLKDNPFLWNDGRYEKMLRTLPEVERRRLLEGDWNVSEGAAFPEFDRDIHVIEPFNIPNSWFKVKGADYGYTSPSCVLWAAVNPEDHTIIVYKELYEKQLDAEQLASKIVEMEWQEGHSVPGVLDGSCWDQRGYTGPTIAQILNGPPYALKFRKADKNRMAGKIQVHQRLRKHDNGRPGLQIFSTCTNLIDELSTIQLSETNSEDVNTHGSDHAYDALRYLLMSRPRMVGPSDYALSIKREARFQPLDPILGY